MREGADFSLIACGGILGEVLSAASSLAEAGVECRVVSAHSLRPFDRSAICGAALETGGIVTVEEHVVEGGLGGLVAETCLEAGCVPRRFARIGLREGFSSVVGSQGFLRSRYGMDAAAISAKVRDLAEGS